MSTPNNPSSTLTMLDYLHILKDQLTEDLEKEGISVNKLNSTDKNSAINRSIDNSTNSSKDSPSSSTKNSGAPIIETLEVPNMEKSLEERLKKQKKIGVF